MLPDPYVGDFHFGPLLLHPWGVMLGIATVSAYFLMEYRLRMWGLRHEMTLWIIVACFVGGAIGGHWFDTFFYQPHRLVDEGPIVLLKLWDGLASLGSFVGAVGLGVFYVKVIKKEPAWPYIEVGVLSLTLAWVIGRIGCTIVWDHPGELTDFVLGMQYNGAELPAGVRHNLGFYEALVAAALCAVYGWSWRQPKFVGWVTAVFGMAYMPVRFAMDFLRANDATYLGLTAGQYMCVAMFAGSVWLYRSRRASPHVLVPDFQPHRVPGEIYSTKRVSGAVVP